MANKSVAVPEMEVFRTEDFYVLMNSESSLWCNKKTGEISIRPGWELANSGDVECLGIFYGLVGKIDFQAEGEGRLLLIKETDVVGELPDGRTVIKICSIACLQPCGPEVTAAELGLKSCKKHKGGGYHNMFELPQKAALAKTWGTIKSATNSIKSTTQQAAALATYQVKGGTRKDLKDKEKFEKRILEELSRVFNETDSFYFCLGTPGSRSCDLTNSLQSFHTPGSVTDDRFFWNKYMLKDISQINSDLAKAWILPIIQGYVQIEHCKVDADPSTFGTDLTEDVIVAIVSRRSRHRAGTRYKRRGLDEDGHCANYVETEQILSCNSHTLSFVQVRGSVPLFWSQPGYKYRPPPHIDKGEAETKVAFEKHMNGEIKQYGSVCIVNLTEQTGKERVIWEGFSQQILHYNSDKVTYAVFDFHEHCRGLKFENVSLLIEKLEEVIQDMGFCWKDKDGIICRQTGVFRVNCIDCLDRTNVVQTAIGKAMLEIQLTKLGLLPPEGHLPRSVRTKFQLLWANNGDVISKQYAGTNALKGDYTRTGERKFTGMMKDGMNSANRYLKTVISDDLRQVTLGVCQGEPIPPNLDLWRPDIEDILSTHVHSYDPITGKLLLGIATFGVARYYLSRFKDVYRQATIDIMQGDTVTEDALDEDNDSVATAEHVKLLIEDCKKFIVSDSSIVLGAWGLINADPQTGDPTETDMDTIVILTKDSYYVADYDDEVDKIVKCQRVALTNIRAVELGQMEIIPPHSALQIFNKAKGKAVIQCCLRLQYCQDESNFAHVFRSSHLRFFNNVAIVIKGDDEMLESLRAICDSFKIALETEYPEICGQVVWKIDPEATLDEAHPPLPTVTNITDLQLDSLRSVVTVLPWPRLFVSWAGLINMKIDFISHFLSVNFGLGSKALSNMTSKFSKLGNTLNPRKKSAQGPSANLPEVNVGDDVNCENRDKESFLPGVGIVMSNAQIESVDPSDVVITEDRLVVTKPTELRKEGLDSMAGTHFLCPPQVRTFSHSSGEVDEKERLDVSSGDRVSLDLSLGISASQSENALRSLKSGFSQAGSVLTSPSAVLSPLTRLAKGVLSAGGKKQQASLTELREAWAASGCRSRLIAV